MSFFLSFKIFCILTSFQSYYLLFPFFIYFHVSIFFQLLPSLFSFLFFINFPCLSKYSLSSVPGKSLFTRHLAKLYHMNTRQYTNVNFYSETGHRRSPLLATDGTATCFLVKAIARLVRRWQMRMAQRRHQRPRKNPCSSVILSTTNQTSNHQRLNPNFHCKKPAFSRLSNGTTKTLPLHVYYI